MNHLKTKKKKLDRGKKTTHLKECHSDKHIYSMLLNDSNIEQELTS